MDCWKKNILAKELEKTDIEKAIILYEENVSENFEGNFPYDRLIAIYKKRGQISESIRIIKQAIFVFENVVCVNRADRISKLSKYKNILANVEHPTKIIETHIKIETSERQINKSIVETKDDIKNEISHMFSIGVANNREYKGKSLLSLLDNYVVVDIETTGYMPSFDGIIEVGAIKYQCDNEIERFHSLINIGNALLDPFIIEHTGITDTMLKGAPDIKDVLPRLLNFIGNEIIVAHNANFDVNFIYDDARNYFGVRFSNDFVDTMRLAKRCFLPVSNHKLTTLAKYFEISQEVVHRSIADCETAQKLYVKLKEYINQNNISLKPKSYDTRIAEIAATVDVDSINADNPFYKKNIVFTGALDSMQRKDAAQIVANLGGVLSDTVTKSTNYLVLGNIAYCSTIKEGKSSKQKRAEKFILEGQDLEIIPESVFISIINEES